MSSVFFFNGTAATEISTLSLHDALPISIPVRASIGVWISGDYRVPHLGDTTATLLVGLMALALAAIGVASARSEEHTSELSHANISYAVFCLKKKTASDDMQPAHLISSS